jgi:hypothetical protein
LPLVLYGCETWSLTLREEQRLKVFKNRVLRRIFKSKRGEVTGGWRKLHSEELHNLVLFAKYNQNDDVKQDEMGMICSTSGEKRSSCRLLVRKPEGNRHLGRPRPSIVDLGEIGWGGVDWIDLAQDRDQWKSLVKAVKNLQVPKNVGMFLSGCTTGGLLE